MNSPCANLRQARQGRRLFSIAGRLLAWCSVALSLSVQAADYQIGVYYFPGWKDNQMGSAYTLPWEKIKPFPEREPVLGWYREGDDAVMNQQLGWMQKYGIDYVVFDWLWGRDNKPHLDHAVNAYLRTPDHHGVKFSIMWANHTDYIFSRDQFEALFHFWAQRYMFRPDYLRMDGKPVVFIFSADVLNKNAQKIGMTSAELIAMADRIFKDEGLEGISFIGGIGALSPGFDYSARTGYSGFSAYNFHGPASFRFARGRAMSHSYTELDQSYQDQWKWMLSHADGTFIVPMSSGWDKRPWGGSKDADHDNSVSTATEFEAHLQAARDTMNANPGKTKKMGVICCWNEYGEGSYIEPTRQQGFSYLEKVKKVFGGDKR